MVTPHEALRQIFRNDRHDLQWIPLPLEGVRVDEVVIFGNGKDCYLILSPVDSEKIQIPVGDVKLVTHDGATVESTSWGDISRTVCVTGQNLSIRRAVVGWPGQDEDVISELREDVRITFQLSEEPNEDLDDEYREYGELHFVVDVELELDHAARSS